MNSLVAASVVAGNVITVSAASAQDLTSVLVPEVNDGSTVGGNSARVTTGRSISESDRAIVGKGDQRATRLEVLNDPLSISLAQGARRAVELVLDLLSSSQVFEDSNTAGAAGRINRDLDLVADAEVKALEGVGVVGDPFEPGVERAIAEEGDTSLENGALAVVAVNADPGGGGGVGTTGGTGDGDGALDVVEAVAVLDGAGPVGGVSGLGGVGGVVVELGALDVSAGRALDELLATGGGGGEAKKGEESGGLHDEIGKNAWLG